jgi:1-acyl-sn-glycerol-3-phosphate acyltransferase
MRRFIGSAFLKAMGWRCEGVAPEATHYVLIAAPHTSNWDFPLMMGMSFTLGIHIAWMGKHTLFKPPFGPMMRALGGVPIERHKRANVVEQMIERLGRPEPLALTVPAEGTRGRTEHWKSGFYHIARGADVPVVLAYLDYGRKVGGIGPTVRLTGDFQRDMDVIRAFYADKTARFPEAFGPVRLKEEEAQGVKDPAALAS